MLASKSKRTNDLFPYTPSPQRCFEKEYLVVVSSDLPDADSSLQPNPNDSTATTGVAAPARNGQSTSTGGKVLVAAIHAYLYHLIRSDTAILYISKLDSSGHSPSQIPITRQLITAFMTHHLDRATRPARNVRIVLFARSQGQYLFPNSSRVPAKRVSGGLGLCAWWKGVYEQVAAEVVQKQQRSSPVTGDSAMSGGKEGESSESTGTGEDACSSSSHGVGLTYLLPSYSASEAQGMLRQSKRPLPPDLTWSYSPPFDSPLFVSPTSLTNDEASTPSAQVNLSGMIPSLPDDPKTRFLDELVANGISAHPAKRLKRDHSSNNTPSDGAAPVMASSEGVIGSQDHGDEASQPEISASTGGKPLTNKQKERERDEADRRAADEALSKISSEEFWERMNFRQECISGDVTGFFALHSEIPTPNLTISSRKGVLDPADNATDLPLAIVDRLHKSLLNCDFGTKPLAVEGTAIWTRSCKGIVEGEIGAKGWEGCIGYVPAKQDLPIVGSAGEGVKRKEEVVTMLQPRKKKKPAS